MSPNHGETVARRVFLGAIAGGSLATLFAVSNKAARTGKLVSVSNSSDPSGDGPVVEQMLVNAGIDASTIATLDWVHSSRSALRCTVAGSDALDHWRRLSEQLPQASYWPVIVGDEWQIEAVAEIAAANERKLGSPETILSAADALDVTALRHDLQLATADDEVLEAGGVGDPDPPIAFETLIDSKTGSVASRLVMAILPVDYDWQVPGVLQWGGWNASPLPQHHVAITRDWHERFGARLVAISSDTLEFDVTDPPREPQPAIELAREQYAYCPDIVDQDRGSVADLAAALVGSHIWHLWWD